MKFAEALADGKGSERIVLHIIKKKYSTAFIRDGYSKEYDIAIPEIDKTIEVKKDFKSQETGNIVIETSMNGQHSGLSTTQADWWVFHPEPTELIWITPETIKDMIDIENYKEVEFTGDGDKASKTAYLFLKEHLVLYSIRKQDISNYIA